MPSPRPPNPPNPSPRGGPWANNPAASSGNAQIKIVFFIVVSPILLNTDNSQPAAPRGENHLHPPLHPPPCRPTMPDSHRSPYWPALPAVNPSAPPALFLPSPAAPH